MVAEPKRVAAKPLVVPPWLQSTLRPGAWTFLPEVVFEKQSGKHQRTGCASIDQNNKYCGLAIFVLFVFYAVKTSTRTSRLCTPSTASLGCNFVFFCKYLRTRRRFLRAPRGAPGHRPRPLLSEAHLPLMDVSNPCFYFFGT